MNEGIMAQLSRIEDLCDSIRSYNEAADAVSEVLRDEAIATLHREAAFLDEMVNSNV